MQLNPRNHCIDEKPIVDQTLHNQVILVTGASRGIGAATAKLLAAHGAAVGVNYHQNEQEARKIVQEIEDAGGKALALQAKRMIPLGYNAQPEDIAGAIYLLALKEAQYITGAYISVNGGSHMP